MEIVPAILDLVDNLNSPTVNKNKKGKRSGISYNEHFPFSCWFVIVAKYHSKPIESKYVSINLNEMNHTKDWFETNVPFLMTWAIQKGTFGSNRSLQFALGENVHYFYDYNFIRLFLCFHYIQTWKSQKYSIQNLNRFGPDLEELC